MAQIIVVVVGTVEDVDIVGGGTVQDVCIDVVGTVPRGR